jgi:hypothetical protein
MSAYAAQKKGCGNSLIVLSRAGLRAADFFMTRLAGFTVVDAINL